MRLGLISNEASLRTEFGGEQVRLCKGDRHGRLEETKAVCAMRSSGLNIGIKYSDNWIFLSVALDDFGFPKCKK